MAMLRVAVPIKLPGTQVGTFVYHCNDGYVYQKNRVTQNSVYFKCAKYEGERCHGRAIYTRRIGFLSKQDTHNHNPDAHEAGVRALRKQILDRCKTGEYVDFGTIVNQERLRYPMDIARQVSLARMRPAMQRARRSIYPEQPHNLEQLADILRRQNRLITMTKDGQDNFFAAHVTAADGSHSIILASRRMLRFAEEHFDYLFGDGTFKSLPSLDDLDRASQIYTVVGNWNHQIVPVAAILMQRRTESAYDSVFSVLHRFTNGAPLVRKIVTDFELAAQNAWRNNFPNVELQGCFFHVVRAFVRYAKEELHMTVHLRRDGPVRVIIRMCCAIPLLPRANFLIGVRVLLNEARNEGRRIYGILRPFFQYILRSWINDPHRNHLMSVYGSVHRTNNTCESHHRQLNRRLKIRHPNIYDFIDCIGSIESDSWIDANSLLNGDMVRRARKASSLANDRRLRRLANDLENAVGPRDGAILRYLRAAAFTFANAYDRAVEEE